MCARTLRNPIARCEEEMPTIPAAPTEDDIKPFRGRIDDIDLKLLQLMNERARSANVIGHIKKQLGLPIYAPQREQEVIRNVIAANDGPLSGEAVRRLYERLIDETRALERQKYQHDSQP